MNLRDLQYVLAVAEHQNFTRAAEAVGVSQPALSNQIKKLELELGIVIFQREQSGVLPTAFGRDMVFHAQQVIDTVASISEAARKHQAPKNQPLRLGMTPTLAAYLARYLRDIFAIIADGRKIVVVEGYPAALAKMVVERTVDMAFIARKSFDTLFVDAQKAPVFTSLWLEPLFLAVRSGHPTAEKPSIWANQVPADQLILFNISFGYDLEKDLPVPSDAAAEATGLDVKSARFETVCRHVAQSDACTIVNAIAAEQFKRDGFGLTFIPFNDEGNMRELGVIHQPQDAHSDIVKSLQEHIKNDAPAGTISSNQTDLIAPHVAKTS